LKTKLLLFLSFFTVSVFGQFRNYSNEFLNIGVDASALSMGKSVVASTNDVNATYWNPAGLIHVDDYQISLMYTSYFAGIASYNFGAYATAIDKQSSIGFSIIRFGVDDILNTTELIDSQGNIDYNRIHLFSAADYAFTASYARNLIFKDLYLGVNAKVIRRKIGDFASSWGLGFDAGLQFVRNNWQIGLLVRDITTSYNVWNINQEEYNKIKDAIPGQNQELPEETEITKPKVQFGVARKFRIGRFFNLLSEIDLHMRFAKTNDIVSTSIFSIDPSFGFQLDYDNLVFLRGGVNNFQKNTEFDGSKSLSIQPNIGVGFKFRGFQIDYALTNIGSVGNALYSNIFSLKFDYQSFR